MALLGFGVSCNSDDKPLDDGIGDEVAMYAALYVEFHLSARVVDEGGEPIEGVEVYGDGQPLDYYSEGSDADGNVNISCPWQWFDRPCVVEFVDTDGEANGGEFESLELDITDRVEETLFTYDSWSVSGYKAELGDVTLNKKDKE